MLCYERSLVPSSKGMEMKDERFIILPQDIIIEILKRLPVKTLIRFQSVCKLWKNLIKSPSFISTHLHYSAHNNPFIFFEETHFEQRNPTFLFSLDSNMKNVEVEITLEIPWVHSIMNYSLIRLVGSCNGLFIVEMDFIGGRDDNDDDSIYFYHLFLWNPATRYVREVPESTYIYSSNPNYGFGVNPVLNDYEIVRIYTNDIAYGGNQRKISADRNYVHYVELYSLRRGSWKKVESVVLNRVRYLKSFQAVVCNGTMFWLGMMDEHDLYMVVSFDIATEIFSLMPLPSSVTPHLDSNIRLSVHENKLAMFWGPYYKVGKADSSFFDLWVMKEEGKSWSWTKKFSVGPTSNWLYPLCIWSNEIVCTNGPIPGGFSESDQDQVENGTNFFLSLFNLTTEEWASHNFINEVSYYESIFNYAESLVCL